MKKTIQELISQTLRDLVAEGVLELPAHIEINIQKSQNKIHGDFYTNIALALASSTTLKPRELASQIASQFPKHELLERVEVAGPGFINFFLGTKANLSVVTDIIKAEYQYGSRVLDPKKSILIEFVSANPTGPLHIGHGRGAACGAVLANLFRKVGFHVDCEYYINDCGYQIDILTLSIWLRYLELGGNTCHFPNNAYQGKYIYEIARQLREKYTNKFDRQLPSELTDNNDDETLLVELIKYVQENLTRADHLAIRDSGIDYILGKIKADLAILNVQYQNWFSESSLARDKAAEHCIEILREKNYCYEKDGALWFCSSKFGDGKDRVLVRSNGETTYFAADIAYHVTKFERGYDHILNIWGADHHGYTARIKATMQALEHPVNKLDIILIQFVSLYQGKNKIQMSTRSGQFIELQELYNEIGVDATLFFYIMCKSDQHLDIDLEFAKSKSNKNPVYYIQYAHARICSVFNSLKEKGYSYQPVKIIEHLDCLIEPLEQKLMLQLSQYPETIDSAVKQRAPYYLPHYLLELANCFHSYYNSHQFLTQDQVLRDARITLIHATQIVLKDGLSLLGVSAPKAM